MKPRIITGLAKNTLLDVPSEGTRPMTDRVKAALFSIINDLIPNAEVLDLFAGSGALGLECISRGANHAVLIDINPEAVKIIERNIYKTKLDVNKIETISTDANDYIKKLMQNFDIIFICPPHKKVNIDIIGNCAEILNKDGIIVAEHPDNIDLPDEINTLKRIDHRIYGITQISLYKLVE